ncbi:MAG TPA: hypothetical protein VLL07_00980, partial [Pontiella sp.]|nr:hypothetical protein [Pontiella sp.]
LSWFMALPLITVVCPVLITLLILYLFAGKSFSQKAGIYAAAIVITEIVRSLLYIRFGQGLNYLLHDQETQMVALVLLIEQFVLGVIIISIVTLRARCR